MRVIKIKFELVMPFFLTVLFSMNFCVRIALSGAFTPLPPQAPVAALQEEVPDIPFGEISSAFLLEPEQLEDVISDCYREPAAREWVITFFTQICGSRDIAEVILTNAENFNVSPSLAFALVWEESRYKPSAINRRNKNGSIDRGLFQLNNQSFPKLTEADFFNPQINAWYGMAHLNWCLDSGGSEIAALAIYNAGSGKVSSGGTPKNTLDYVSRILASRRKIDSLFRIEITRALETIGTDAIQLGLAPDTEPAPDFNAGTLAKAPQTDKPDNAAGILERSRFALLSPLSGR
ncbi:hypothetical protein FACS189476_07720 [Spirochaetia bacterium]|nr:hypothetical protein FACS189476_07720 [Spirochaetia bacterium]